MKNRFNFLDLRSLINELKLFIANSYIKNVYSDKKSFIIRFNNHSLLIEPGIRMHLVKVYANNDLNHFASLMRILNRQKLKEISQCGFDRIALLDFVNFKLYLEFFSHGNIIITDKSNNIVNLLRTVPGIYEKGQTYVFNNAQLDLSISVLLAVPFNKFIPVENLLLSNIKAELETFLGLSVESFKTEVLNYIKCKNKAVKDSNKDLQVQLSGEYAFENVKTCKKYAENISETEINSLENQITKDLNNLCFEEGDYEIKKLKNSTYTAPESNFDLVIKKFNYYMKDFLERISNIKNFGIVLFKKGSKDSIFPIKINTELDCKTFESFNDACMFYFTSSKVKKEVSKDVIIEQKQKLRIEQLERSIEEDKKKAEILNNSKLAAKILQIFEMTEEQKLDWRDFFLYKKEEDEKKNEVSLAIKKVNFIKKTAIIEIEGTEIEIAINKNIYYNVSKLYERAKAHENKIRRTEEALKAVLENVRKKEKPSVCMQKRKPYWFEKFHFVILPGKIILSGKNSQQNEILVKKFLTKLYFHCNVQGGSSVILEDFECVFEMPVKNVGIEKEKKPFSGEVDPIKVAGEVALCMSKCWNEKVARDVFYVNADQVSKSAPTGEYLTKGSFLVRGKKSTVEVFKLEYGVGIIFRFSDKEEVEDDNITNEDIRFCTHPEKENIIHAMVVTAPWSFIKNFKYKARLVHGNIRKGLLIKELQNIFNKESQDCRENLFIRKIHPDEYTNVLFQNNIRIGKS